MKNIFNFLLKAVLAVCSCNSVYGFGFHGSTSFRGGGFGGGGFQSGYHTNDFDRGGMGGGGMGNYGGGGFRQLSSGSFSHNGGFQGDERMPTNWGVQTGVASFDHAGVPTFGGGAGGYSSFHPLPYNTGGFTSNPYGASRLRLAAIAVRIRQWGRPCVGPQ